MLFDTSRAIISSMPLRLTVSSLEPNCGPAKTMTCSTNAASSSDVLTAVRRADTIGIRCRMSVGLPNDCNERFLLLKNVRNSSASSGTSSSRYK